MSMSDMESIMKAMEQAQVLSKLMNPGGGEESASASGGAPNTDGQMDMSAVMKAMEMAQMLKTILPQAGEQQEAPRETGGEHTGQAHAQAEKAVRDMEILSFDDMIDTPALKTIKSAIPYLEHQYRRPLGVAIKFIEIQRVLEKYSDHAVSIQSVEGIDWRKEMLKAIRPNMDQEKKYMLDMLIMIMDMKEVADQLQVIREASNGKPI